MFCRVLKVFTRVGGSSTIDQQSLPVTFSAKFVRFQPITQNNWNCLRVEMYIPSGELFKQVKAPLYESRTFRETQLKECN